MNHLQLWNLQSLWEQQHSSSFSSSRDITPLLQKYQNPLHQNISPFRLVETFTPDCSKAGVFIDEHGVHHDGLMEYQIIFQHQQKPIYLLDNHDWALFPFWEMRDAFGIHYDIVHIDAHRDDAVCPHNVPQNITALTIQEVVEKCVVSDYLDVALRSHTVSRIHSVTQACEFESFTLPSAPFLLNLDLDIFGEEGTCVSDRAKMSVISRAWKHADAVILATSPGFIDQQDALQIVEILLSEGGEEHSPF